MSDLVDLLEASTRSRFTALARHEHKDGHTDPVTLHRLDVDGPLLWTYTVSGTDGRPLWSVSCDGTTLTTQQGEVSSAQAVPPRFDPLNAPASFYTWLGLADTWLVEMLRPLDVLALAELVEVSAADGAVLVLARPNWREPSPYNGIPAPGTSSFRLRLDPLRGALVWAGTHDDDAGRTAPVDRWELLELTVR